MLTLILAIAHARSTNKDFQPELMYFGAFILDLTTIQGLIQIFS